MVGGRMDLERKNTWKKQIDERRRLMKEAD